ncbi:sortase-dependent protein [Kitasatospora sp. NPDC085464]|uniref:sortase-dependent protein n=1 Tax=Kitasatospora sp. NPDC085464 TaxID=3364063 RepID=UPI0037C57A98
MSRSRTDRTPARRVLAACALTGAALLAAVTGGQAWADGAPKTATPTPGVVASPAAAAVPTATPAPADPKAPAPVATPSAARGAESPKAVPAPQAPNGTQPQVREVPKGAAQAGDGSGATDGSGLMLAGGGAVAAIGAGALGFAVLRRRSGARG